jgi:hypothetical protein
MNSSLGTSTTEQLFTDEKKQVGCRNCQSEGRNLGVMTSGERGVEVYQFEKIR